MLEGIFAQPPSGAASLALVAAGMLWLGHAFVSASEVAFFLLSPSDLCDIGERKHPADGKLGWLLDRTEHVQVALLLAVATTNALMTVLCCFFAADVFRSSSWEPPPLALGGGMAVLLAASGGVLPRLLAVRRPLAFCRRTAPWMKAVAVAFYPLAWLLLCAVPPGWRPPGGRRRSVSADDLSHALELGGGGELSEESKLLKGIARFGGETAKEVMTSRPDVVVLEYGMPYREVLKCIVENAYSRMPVYSETKDNIKGVLYIKDLFPHLGRDDGFRWQELIRPAWFVPETKRIDDLLRDFQANKIHIAIVVDEFGGTSGIVTMEDVIEEIVGEIRDEYDDEECAYCQIDSHTWVFEGKTQLTDFYKATKVGKGEFGEAAGDAGTVAGLLLELKGEFPALHEAVVCGKYEFTVLAMDERRILKVKFAIREQGGG